MFFFSKGLTERVSPGTSVNKKRQDALKVDLCISHSWSCPSWMKLLAMCHFLNLDLAIISSITASTMAVVFLVPWHFEQQMTCCCKSYKRGSGLLGEKHGWHIESKQGINPS